MPHLLGANSGCFGALQPGTPHVASGVINCFDALAAIFGCLALLLLLERRWYAGTAVMTLAVFTKETALPMAFAGFVTYYMMEWSATRVLPLRRIAKGGVLLLPIALWGFSRKIVFGSLLGGVPTIGSLGAKDLLLNAALFPLNWPLGLAEGPLDPLATARALFLRQPEQVSYVRLALLAANLLISFWAAIAAVRVLYKKRRIAFDSPVVILLVWVAAISCYLLVLRLKPRFGYLFYLLGIPLLVRALADTIVLAAIRAVNWRRRHIGAAGGLPGCGDGELRVAER